MTWCYIWTWIAAWNLGDVIWPRGNAIIHVIFTVASAYMAYQQYRKAYA